MKRFCLQTLLLLVCFLSACSPKEAKTVWYSFTDDAGRPVTLSSEPQTIAVLTSSFTEIWLLAGGNADITVGESIERGLLSAEDTILVDSGAGKSINIEILLAAAPDFVIASADIAAQVETAELMSSVGIPAALFRVESFSDYLRVLKILTEITGCDDAYRLYGTEIEAEIHALLAALPDISDVDKPKILFIRAGSTERSTKAKTAREHFACAMLDELLTYNIADNAPHLIDGLSMEEILREDPSILFLSAMGDEAAAAANMEQILSSETWQHVRAVRDKRVYWLPKDLFQYKPNARWAEAYQMLAEMIYEK